MKTSNIFVATTITILSLITTASAQVIWVEDFASQEGKGIVGGTPPVTNMTGITKWTVDTTVPFTTNVQSFMVISNSLKGTLFEANNVKDECIWQSEVIDISTNDFVELTVELSEVGTLAQTDFIETYYSVNGQAQIPFYENGALTSNFTEAIAKQEAVTGSNLVITIKADNGAQTSKHRFDNVTVTAHTPVSNQPPSLAVSDTSKSVVAGNMITFDLIATEEYMDLSDIITNKMTSSNLDGASFPDTSGTSVLTSTFIWTPDTPGNYTATFESSDKDGTTTLDVDIKVYPSKKTIWLEDFNDPDINGKGAYGPTNTVDLVGVTKWRVDVTNAVLSDDEDFFKVTDSEFKAQDTDGEVVWISTNIDISTYSTVSASVDLREEGPLAGTEYIRVYYCIDNGTEQLFDNNGDMTDDFDSATASTTDFSGNNLQIMIRCRNIYGTRIHYFDDVKVSTPIPSGFLLYIR